MQTRTVILSLTALLTLGACGAAPDGDQAPDAIDRELARRQAIERKLEAVVGIARELRDSHGSVQPPTEADLISAVRQRLPATTPDADPLLDAWNLPLRYELVNEREGNRLQTGFRVSSAGPNGRFESSGGDDLQHAAIITETIRGD